MRNLARSACWFVVLLALGGCDQSTTRVSTLWTNIPEMATYVERFNASQRDWQLLVEYKEDLTPLLLTPGRKADLIVARDLTSSAVKETLVPLDFLFDGGNLARASFFRRSIDAGMSGDHSKLLPVCIDFPIVVFSRSQSPDVAGFSIDLATLKEFAAKFAPPSDAKRLKKLGFSPRWEGFGLTMLRWQGVSFHEGFQGALAWNAAKLESSLAEFQNWPGATWEQSSEFRRKYLQSDYAPHLLAGRIQFYPSTLSAFLERPWEERRDLDFRYLEREGRILSTDTTVWAGIPSSSMNRGAAERFLAWFFRADTQRSLITQGRTDDDRTFGIAHGLSAISLSDPSTLVAAFPALTGRVPGSDKIEFPDARPTDWPALREQVLRPWLETPHAQEATLREALEKYRTRASRN